MRVARYTTVSVLSIATTQLLLQAFTRTGTPPTQSNVAAVLIAAVPAFLLNREWTWRDRRGGSLRRQAAIFWATVGAGLAASTLAVAMAAGFTSEPLVVGAASFAAFGVLWVARFFVLDRLAFVGGGVDDVARSWRPRVPSLATLAVGSTLLVVAAIHAWGMYVYPARFDDEGTYVSQAWAVMADGDLSHYTYWYDHPPVGWLQLVPWLWVTGALDRAPTTVAAGRELMLVVQLVSSLLLYAWSRRLGVARGFALVAMLLFSLSPLALYWHRQVLLDNLAVMWVLAAFALAVSPRGRLAAHAGAGACFAVAVLTKETALLVLPALAYQLWQGADPAVRRYSFAVAGSLFASILAFYPLLALLRGELLPGEGHVSLWEGIAFQLFEREGSGSVFESGTNARQIVDGWLRLDPWLLGAGAALAPVAVLARRLRPAVAALAISIAVIARPGYLPVPYLIVLLPFAAIVAVGVADSFWRLARRRPRSNGFWARAANLSLRGAGAVALSTLVVVAGARVGPAWAADLERQLEAEPDTRLQAAEDWVRANVDRDSALLVDNTIWLDLVLDGFERDRLVWYYKLDLDPGVGDEFPGGWRDFDYIVATETMRATVYLVPTIDAALRHSRVVASFGRGFSRIEIRRIQEE
jgi:putative flippase GtrA/4-amino-4-deoxy-L-arabinose transferase-like glycosyltransferase